MVTTAARGRILIWEGASLWLMDALSSSAIKETDFHAHHAVQVTMSLGGRFEVRTRDHSLSCAAAVAPDEGHIFQAVGLVALLFVEPESRAGRAIARRLIAHSSLAAVPSDLVADSIDRLKQCWPDGGKDDAFLMGVGRELVARLAGEVHADLPDPRVQKIVAYMGSHMDRPITLTSAAQVINLSPSRARHLFVEQTGLPLQTYLLWLRLMKAVRVYAGGGSLTDAAHDAGFSDSAHFSRTFRRMFGIPAAALRLD